MRRPGKRIRGHIADTVSRCLDGMHVIAGKPVQNIGRFDQLDPVELNVLAGGKMAESPIKITGNAGQTTHLVAGQHTVRNGDAQHIGMQLKIQAVLQAQRLEFIFGKLAAKTAFNLITELRRALGNELPVKGIILVY